MTYLKWLSDRMWKNGYHLFADDEKESEIKRIAYQISRTKDVFIVKAKYMGSNTYMLYSDKSQFPIIPTEYYYSTLDKTEGKWLYLSDTISCGKSLQM